MCGTAYGIHPAQDNGVGSDFLHKSIHLWTKTI